MLVKHHPCLAKQPDKSGRRFSWYHIVRVSTAQTYRKDSQHTIYIHFESSLHASCYTLEGILKGDTYVSEPLTISGKQSTHKQCREDAQPLAATEGAPI